MAVLRLQILDKDNVPYISNESEDEVTLAYRGFYKCGDKIQVESDTKNIYLKIRLDDSVDESWVYLKDEQYTFKIPFEEERKPYGKKAFCEERHWAYVSVIEERELKNYRNLAHNAFDTVYNQSIFPHVTSNVHMENSQFYARNIIDGVFETCNHGSWPHESWGINQKKDAWVKLDFGNVVNVDEIVLYLRSDFPHDICWEQALITFSDGTHQKILLEKTGKAQKIKVEKKQITWIKLSNFVVPENEEGFPALSQIKVMGNM